MSDKVKAFWKTKLASHEDLLQVLEPIGNEELKKQYLERANQVWQVSLKEVLEKVNKELVGPYALGSSDFQFRSLHSVPPTLRLSFSFDMRTVFSFLIFPSFSDPAGPSEIDTELQSCHACVL